MSSRPCHRDCGTFVCFVDKFCTFCSFEVSNFWIEKKKNPSIDSDTFSCVENWKEATNEGHFVCPPFGACSYKDKQYIYMRPPFCALSCSLFSSSQSFQCFVFPLFLFFRFASLFSFLSSGRAVIVILCHTYFAFSSIGGGMRLCRYLQKSGRRERERECLFFVFV
jgi:hypothetical protein